MTAHDLTTIILIIAVLIAFAWAASQADYHDDDFGN
jgi:hypothetical protein